MNNPLWRAVTFNGREALCSYWIDIESEQDVLHDLEPSSVHVGPIMCLIMVTCSSMCSVSLLHQQSYCVVMVLSHVALTHRRLVSLLLI